MITEGTRVEYINKHSVNPEDYPPTGTLGTVIYSDDIIATVRWDNCPFIGEIWVCDICDLKEITSGRK